MGNEETYLDCCSAPTLDTIKNVSTSRHGTAALRQCTNCKTCWFYRYSEYTNWAEGKDYDTVWYTQLKEDEAKAIMASDEPDLSFLANKPSFVEDESGVTRGKGQPERGYDE